MQEEQVFLTENIQMTSARSEYKSDKERSIQAVKNALDSVKGVPVNTSVESNIVSGIPNFVHLNPELLAVAILFRFRTNKKKFTEIPVKKALSTIQELLKLLFPTVLSSSASNSQGLALRADAIRYILLHEEYMS